MKLICPDCGQPLPANAPTGLCPNCLLGLGLRQPSESEPPPTRASIPTEPPGAQIGRYKLLEPIGEGGFGTVWMAEQTEPVRRKVALKIIKLGMDTKEVVARFEAERQALALMDHPNIARVFDGGTTDAGRPYFVMELVNGVRLTDYCDAHRLDTEARLKLFIEVCQAVQHAHQKGVIHRDLKPNNVLVTESDGRAVPKVIDFGIAKATSGELTDRTLFTRFNQVIGTPAYMSPEQAGLGKLDVDTRSDIYSLGVLLYELLTGQPPFSNEEFLKAGLDEILRTIREKEPPKPSTCLSTLSMPDQRAVAQHRASEPVRLSRSVRGDLDWIVMKCLEKDRRRRYETANGLARDLERHLSDEPVVAAAPSLGYKFRKFASKHRTALSLSGAFAVLLVAGVVASTWQAVRANKFARAETTALQIAQTNWLVSQHSLYHSMLTQARAQLAAKEIGQHHDVLGTLKKAAELNPSVEVRSEVVAALVKPDFRQLHSWPMYVPTMGVLVGFSPDLKTYVGARLNPGGACELRAAETGKLLREYSHAAQGTRNPRLSRSLFSPDGQHFAAFFNESATDIWALDGPEPVVQLAASEQWGNVDFTPDGRQFVAYSTNNGLCVWTLADRAMRQLQPPGREPRFVQLNPAGDRLALVRRTALEILEFPGGKPLGSIRLDNARAWAAWHPDGRRVAVSSVYTHEILVYDAVDSTLRARFVAPTDAKMFAFHPNGQWLLSLGAGWLRLWDLRGAQELLRANLGADTALQLAKDGSRFAVGNGPHEVGLFELTAPRGFREFHGTASTAYRAQTMDLSPSGRFLITAGNEGLRIWDAQAAAEVLYLQRPAFSNGHHLFFGPEDKEIIYSRKGEGTFRRQFTWQEGDAGQPAIVCVGPEELTAVPQSTFLCSVGPDRRTWLCRDSATGAIVMPEGRMENSRPISKAAERLLVELSPDGQWSAAVCNEERRYLEVWDAQKLTVATNMGGLYLHRAVFSPDSKWLVGASDKGYHFWETATWRERYLTAATSVGSRSISFSADSKLAALQQQDDTVLLVSLQDGREVVKLKPPFPLLIGEVRLSADGTRLWALGLGHRVYEWNLAELRQELRNLHLDWPD